jgi:Protein of unknown function (DUF1659).
MEMAVTAVPLTSTLVVTCQTGETPAGAPVTRKKSLSGLRADATVQDAYDAASALFSLVQDPVVEVILSNNSELVDM